MLFTSRCIFGSHKRLLCKLVLRLLQTAIAGKLDADIECQQMSEGIYKVCAE